MHNRTASNLTNYCGIKIYDLRVIIAEQQFELSINLAGARKNFRETSNSVVRISETDVGIRADLSPT